MKQLLTVFVLLYSCVRILLFIIHWIKCYRSKSRSYYQCFRQLFSLKISTGMNHHYDHFKKNSLFRAKSLCHIFTEMAETFLYHMVHQPDIGFGELHTLDLLLECISHPDYEVTRFQSNFLLLLWLVCRLLTSPLMFGID